MLTGYSLAFQIWVEDVILRIIYALNRNRENFSISCQFSNPNQFLSVQRKTFHFKAKIRFFSLLRKGPFSFSVTPSDTYRKIFLTQSPSDVLFFFSRMTINATDHLSFMGCENRRSRSKQKQRNRLFFFVSSRMRTCSDI